MAFVASFALGLGDALPLALQHTLTLGLPDGGDHAQHEPAGAGGGIEGLIAGHRQDPQRDLLALQPGDDRLQVAHGPGEPIQICANELVVLADVFEGLFKLAALGDRGDRLAENLVAPCAAKLALLRFQTCDAASKAVRLANKSAQ